jgi:parallel beta-helix repeat protein
MVLFEEVSLMNLKKFLFSILLSLPKNEHHLQPVKKLLKNLSSKNSMRSITKGFTLFLIVIFLGICNSNILTPSSGATILVTSAKDTGLGTLRNALGNAQAEDTITFDTATFPPASPVTITLLSILPSLSQGNITLDGSNAGVILDGSSLGGGTDGIDIRSDYNIVKGLEFLSFSSVGITVNGGKFNVISDNTIISCGQGIEFSSSNNNTIINNTVYNNNYNGIRLLDNSNNNTITNNTVYDNIQQSGIWFDLSSNNTISNNTIYNNDEDGIRLLTSSNNNIIVNNTVYNNNWVGVRLQSSIHNTRIANNTVYGNNENGILIEGPVASNDNIVSNNTVHNNFYNGISLAQGSSFNTITNNTVYSNNENGIILSSSTQNNAISYNTVYNNVRDGIIIMGSDNNTVSHNTVRDNLFRGIVVEMEFGNTIDSEDNIINANFVYSNNDHGIFLNVVNNNTVTNNTVHDNELDGISLGESANNTLVNNTVDNNRYGFLLWNSKNNTIGNNSLTNNGFYWGGSNIENYIQKLVANNSVNGKPLVYWEDKNGGTMPEGAGQIFLFNCTYVTIADQTLSNISIGILTAYCSHLTIQNNTLLNSRWGIFVDRYTNKTTLSNNTAYNNLGDIQLWLAYDNVVSNNTLGNNSNYGLVLDSAERNTFSNNTIFKTNLGGIWLWGSNNNNFSHNIIYDNEMYGIIIDDTSSDTIVKFNDFLGNNIGGSQANDTGSNNVFEYNYWSDWTSPDGNADGVVDNPYPIDGTSNNQDHYPLVTLPSTHHLILPMITSPSESAVLSGDVIISWTASVDTWEFPVQYFVYYSTGGSWTLLASNLTVTSYTWDSSTVPDGTNYLLKVEAISSGRLTKSSTISIEIDNIPPPPPPPPATTPTTSKTKMTTKITPGWNILLMLPVLFILLSRMHYKKGS